MLCYYFFVYFSQIDRYEVYTCKEFLTKILENHKIATENYNKVRENLEPASDINEEVENKEPETNSETDSDNK